MASRLQPFPTAFELKYRFFLQNLQEQMLNAQRSFIDITLCNNELEQYLRDKGYILVELRYDYKETEQGRVFGFFGRTTGDGTVLTRIIWDYPESSRTEFGDFRA